MKVKEPFSIIFILVMIAISVTGCVIICKEPVKDLPETHMVSNTVMVNARDVNGVLFGVTVEYTVKYTDSRTDSYIDVCDRAAKDAAMDYFSIHDVYHYDETELCAAEKEISLAFIECAKDRLSLGNVMSIYAMVTIKEKQ